MRRFEKTKNIIKANLLAEERYLETKGLIKEDMSNQQLDELSPETRNSAVDAAYKQGRGGQGDAMQKTARGLNQRDNLNAKAAEGEKSNQQLAAFYGKTINLYKQAHDKYVLIGTPQIVRFETQKVGEDNMLRVSIEKGYLIYSTNNDILKVSHNGEEANLDRSSAVLIQRMIKTFNPNTKLMPQNGSMGKIIGIQIPMPEQPQQ